MTILIKSSKCWYVTLSYYHSKFYSKLCKSLNYSHFCVGLSRLAMAAILHLVDSIKTIICKRMSNIYYMMFKICPVVHETHGHKQKIIHLHISGAE